MKIFLDTNIVMDSCLPERAGRELAQRILAMENPSETRIYMSSLTVATVSYFLRKHVGKERAKEKITLLFKDHFVLPVSDICVYDALRSDCPDFEDAMLIACADYGDCDCIITNNVKDFRGYAPLPVFSPEEFIAGCHEAVVRRHEYYEYLESLPDACFIDEGPGEKNLGN